MRIREAKLQDVQSVLNIYKPYIVNTEITYEYEVPDIEEFRSRMEKIMKQYPWLIAEEKGIAVGYAYAGPFQERAAFAWDCEVSVYILPQFQNSGVASALYRKLFDLLQILNYVKVYALINVPNERSIRLHEKFGFIQVGYLKHTGFKHGAWRDLVILEKQLSVLNEPKQVKRDWILELHNLNTDGDFSIF